VRISGGGRCNVTHACFDARNFVTRYPRGEKELIGPCHQFQAADTVEWFAARGVQLKSESDGRMFPVTDSSQTIVDCLIAAAGRAGVVMRTNSGLETATRRPEGGFDLTLSSGEQRGCDILVLATGGCRAPALGRLAESLGHTLEPPVPSLFTFHIDCEWLRALAGVTVEDAEVRVAGGTLKERGPLLVTHWGLSGPSILRLSAWGARELHSRNYKFPLQVHWLPGLTQEALQGEFDSRRRSQGAKQLVNAPIAPLSARLWEQLVVAAGIRGDSRWASMTREQESHLIRQLGQTMFPVTG
jgi:predicted Rossmann fold flavoprotein